jgi:hypothetical protein
MAEEIKKVNEETNQEQEVNQENTTPETPAKDSEEIKTEEVKKEGIFTKGKKFCKKYVVPGAKATARVAGKMAIITGGILGAVFVAGIGAGLAAKDTNEAEEEETDDLDPVDESLSGGDEEVDKLMDAPEDEDDEEEDSAEE